MTWKAGESGNPRGRRANPLSEKFRKLTTPHIQEIVEALVNAAKGGDAQAAKLLLDRAIPPLKATDSPIVLKLPAGGLAEQGRTILDALANGALPPNQATALLHALSGLARLVEVDELERRISELEKKGAVI